jgi:membrane protein implicated in regulation of membrane protease activity
MCCYVATTRSMLMVATNAKHRERRPTRVAQVGAILTAALVMYATGVVVVLGAIIAMGGGVSCDADCVPLARFMNDVAPWGTIAWIAISLATATVLVRHWTHRRSHRDRSGDAGAR